MRTFLLIIFSLLFADIGFSQVIPADSMYLAQIPPTGTTPKKFFLPVRAGSFTAERLA
jgi:hypothetical protein